VKRGIALRVAGVMALAGVAVVGGRWPAVGGAARAQVPARAATSAPAARARSVLLEPGGLFRQPGAATARPATTRGAGPTAPLGQPAPAGGLAGRPRLPGGASTSPGRPASPASRGAGAGTPADADPAPPPRVAVLATRPGSRTTDLILQPLDGTAAAAPVARFAHLEDTEVQGTVVPTTDSVLVIAGTERRRDPAFGASLLLVGAADDTRQVVDRVYHGTRPLVLDDGRAIVQRGIEGDEPSAADMEAGRLRIDHLTVEQIDLTGTPAKVLSSYDGYIAYVTGALRHEVFVYRVGPDGADIIGVDADSGRERTIVRPLAPFARDFSVDAQSEALLFTNADADQPGFWVAEKLSVAAPPAATPVVAPRSRIAVSARIEHLERSAQPALVPTAWVGKAVALNRGIGGLQIVKAATPTPTPFPSGVDVVREFFTARSETFALAVHHTAGKLPEPVVIQASTMAVQRLAVPAQARVDVAGMVQRGLQLRPQIRRLDATGLRPITVVPGMFKRYVPPAAEPADDQDGTR
jgi:hypothetical protein